MTSPEPLTGACLCGAVRFELTQPPVGAAYCHCTRCQRRTGTAASVSVAVPRGAVKVLSGEDRIRVYEPPDGSLKAFCATCGSGLWSQRRDDPEHRFPRMGLFDRDPGVRPALRQYVDFAAPWEPIPDDGLPRYGGPRPT